MFGLTVHVSYFSSGTSKWNEVEHRLFFYINMNWKGVLLKTIQMNVN